MRAEILVGRERRRRWSTDDKLRIVREAFAPGARVALVARRRDVSRSQIYQWRAALREGRLSELGSDVVGFVPVAMPTVPGAAPNDDCPGTDSVGTGATIEIGLVAGRRYLKVPTSLPSAELRRLIRAVEGA
jgi:transposase